MKTVAMVLFPDFLLLDMAGPMEVFSIANRYLKPADHYVLTTIGTEPGALRASNGVKVQADQPIDQACDGFDLLLVPGGPGAYNEKHPPLLEWLKHNVSRSRTYGSICTGAFVLNCAPFFSVVRCPWLKILSISLKRFSLKCARRCQRISLSTTLSPPVSARYAAVFASIR